jgi:D-3-phosphoglycerate dehydrogenase
MKIVVTDHAFGDLNYERAVAEKHQAVFEEYQCTTTQETCIAVKGASVIFNSFAPMNEQVLGSIQRGSIVIRYGVGVDNVDLDAAKRSGITICNVPDYGATVVADHASMFILALVRRLMLFNDAVKKGQWGVKTIVPQLPDMTDLTIGFLGFGRIAQEVAKRMAAFGSNLIANDPYADQKVADALAVELVETSELFKRTNVLSLHAPLIDATRHIINRETIATMPDGAIIVNTSRGSLIDESALVDALKSGKLSSAALDVFEMEPLQQDSPLFSAPNLLLSPHAAFYSDQSVDNLQRLAAEEADRHLSLKPLRSPVTT